MADWDEQRSELFRSIGNVEGAEHLQQLYLQQLYKKLCSYEALLESGSARALARQASSIEKQAYWIKENVDIPDECWLFVMAASLLGKTDGQAKPRPARET